MKRISKHLRKNTEGEKIMETIVYVVERLDGDYAHLTQEEHPELGSKLVARALLPENIEEGGRIIYEWLQYRLA